MLDAATKLLPLATRFMHQIAPSVVATLIAAGLISGYNHTFSAHVQQPRMAALHAGEDAAAAPAPVKSVAPPATSTIPMTKLPETKPTGPVTEYITIHERAVEEREPEKEKKAEAGKDQTALKVATPLPPARPTAPRPEPRVVSAPAAPAPVAAVAPAPVNAAAPVVPRVTAAPAPMPMGPAPVAAAPMASPPMAAPVVVGGPAAVIAQEPPPVLTGKPYVTVPDRPNQRPTYEANLDETAAPPPPQPQGPLGVIVNTLRPSSIFARMREFGDKIEQTGNDILPNIRQQ